MKAIELFAGGGGLALGVAVAGFSHEAVLEWNQDCCETIRENKRRGIDPVAGWTLHEGDVREFDYAQVPGQIDLFAGGPPCQPFSMGGKHGGLADRQDMFPAVAEAARILRPRGIRLDQFGLASSDQLQRLVRCGDGHCHFRRSTFCC